MFTKNSTYSELKAWFEEQIEAKALPLSLDAQHVYYSNVPDTAQIYIDQVDREFERHGRERIKKSAPAMAAKNNLFKLWEALQVKEKWNAPRPVLPACYDSEFNNQNQ